MKENRHKDLARHRMGKATNCIFVARQQFQLGNYAEAVSKSYYSILHAMRSLLALKHYDSRRHEGVIVLFHEHYVRQGVFPKSFSSIIRKAKELREEADYGDFIEVSRAVATEEIMRAEEFIRKAEEVLVRTLAGRNKS